MLLKYANQNNYFIIYISFLVLVTNAGRIHLTKNKKIVSLIFNYLCRHHRCRIFVSNYFFFNINTLRYARYKNIQKSSCYILFFAHKNAKFCIGEQKQNYFLKLIKLGTILYFNGVSPKLINIPSGKLVAFR